MVPAFWDILFQPSLIDITYRNAVQQAWKDGVEIIALQVGWNRNGECQFITDKLPTKIIIILAVFIVIAFSYKFYKLPNVWKVYLRTVLVYFIVLILSLKYNNRYNNISGTLIIVDALMGLQSRHIFDRIGLLL